MSWSGLTQLEYFTTNTITFYLFINSKSRFSIFYFISSSSNMLPFITKTYPMLAVFQCWLQVSDWVHDIVTLLQAGGTYGSQPRIQPLSLQLV